LGKLNFLWSELPAELTKILEAVLVRWIDKMDGQEVCMALHGLKGMEATLDVMSPGVPSALLTAFERTVESMDDWGICNSFQR
jgi:hypothetical protein